MFTLFTFKGPKEVRIVLPGAAKKSQPGTIPSEFSLKARISASISPNKKKPPSEVAKTAFPDPKKLFLNPIFCDELIFAIKPLPDLVEPVIHFHHQAFV